MLDRPDSNPAFTDRVTKSAARSSKRLRPNIAPIEDEDEDDDEDEYDKAPAATARSVPYQGRSGSFRSLRPRKLFVWQSCRVTVFLKYHRENELNPNPWCKA
jgi:hypothetical protein